MNRITEEQLLDMINNGDMDIGMNMECGSDSEFDSSGAGSDEDGLVILMVVM